MNYLAMLTPYEQLLYSKGYNFQEHFIKDLWNSRWTTRNFWWITWSRLRITGLRNNLLQDREEEVEAFL